MSANVIAILQTGKSGQEVAKHPKKWLSSFSKLTSKYWESKVYRAEFRPGELTSTYYCRVQHGGRREAVPLATGDRTEAAKMAAKFYGDVRAKGWEAALTAHDPARAKRFCATRLGDLTEKIMAAGLRPRTQSSYLGGLRWFGARALQLKTVKKTFGPAGSAAFRVKVDALPLERLTPELIRGLIARKLQEAKGDVRAELSARISINQFLRNAKAALKVAVEQGAILPEPMPFEGIKFLKDSKAPTYKSKIKVAELVRNAKDAFEQKASAAYTAILLAIGAGLRRGEMEHLLWRNIDPEKNEIDVTACASWRPKTAESAAVVHVDPALIAILEGFRGGPDDRVTDGPALDDATAWLRKQGVTTDKPLHELRKEFGSIVYASSDLLAASKQLRHASLSVTASTYIENRKHIAPKIGEMLAGKVTQ